MRLPFDVDRLSNSPIMYDERTWRQTPRLRISRDIDPFLDIIAMETANEVTEKAEQNLLRTFHYNMMSERDFMNRDFERLVQFVAEFIDMLYATRRIRTPDQDLIRNIADAVSLHSCKQVLDFPDLEEICARSGDARMMRALDTNIGQYQKLVQDLDNMHNADARDIRTTASSSRGDFRSQYAGASSGSSMGYRGSREVARNVSARDAGGEYAVEPRAFRRDDLNPTDRPMQRRMMEGSRSFIDRQRVDDNGYRFVPQQVDNRDYGGVQRDVMNNRATSYEAAPPAPPPPEMTPPPPPPPAPMETTSTVQPGRCVEPIPAFRGIIGSFPILNETTMNQQEHSRVYGLDEDTPNTSMKEEVLRTLSLAQAVTDGSTDSEAIKDHVVVLDEAIVCSNVESLTNFVSDEAAHEIIKRSGENKAGERKIIHTFGIVDNSMSGFTHLSDIRKVLGKAGTLKEVVQGLRNVKAAAAQAPREAAFATDIRAAVAFYDRILTREVNAYFRDVLKVTAGDVTTSIVEDFDELLSTIQATGNNELINAMLVFFTQLNGNLREALLPEHEVVESVKKTQDMEEGVGGFCVMPLSYIVTHIPFTMEELGFELNTSKAIMATDGQGFIRAALDISALQATGKLENSLRLMVTRDRNVMRVSTYPGRKDVIILSPYKH